MMKYLAILLAPLFLISCQSSEETLCTRDGYGMEIAKTVTYKPNFWETCND